LRKPRLGLFLSNGNQFNNAIIGAHFGNVAGPAGNVSVFWLLGNIGPAGISSISLDDTQGFSNAVLYTPGGTGMVPEPATWAMMLIGFGFLGAAMRRRPKLLQRAQFAF
jgi:hypothetical protein